MTWSEDPSITGFLPPNCPYPESDGSATDLRSYPESVGELTAIIGQPGVPLEDAPSPQPPQQTSHEAPIESLTIHRRSSLDDKSPPKGAKKHCRKALEKIEQERRKLELRREALAREAAEEDRATQQFAARVSDFNGAREGLVTPLKSTSTPSRTPASAKMIQTPSTKAERRRNLQALMRSVKEENDLRHQKMKDHNRSLCQEGMDHTTACHFKTDKLISEGQTKSDRRLRNLERGMETLLSQSQSKPEYVTCSTTAGSTTSMGTESDRMAALEKENRRLNGIIEKRLGYKPKRRR